MAREAYIDARFSADTMRLITLADEVASSFYEKGYTITVRQLYYQMVAANHIPNDQRSYKRLAMIVGRARLAGLIDWDHICDLTRELRRLPSWDSPSAIMSAAAAQYRRDNWSEQPIMPEVWVEKDALRNIVAEVCNRLETPYFSCRGYTSLSEMRVAARRLAGYIEERDQIPVVLHLADHDPSGVDMTRDLWERLDLFTGGLVDPSGGSRQFSPHTGEFYYAVGDDPRRIYIERLALNYDQVRDYNLPPNPAKRADSRYETYRRTFGESCWELDALDPRMISSVIEEAILRLRDDGHWESSKAIEREHIARLRIAAGEV